MCVGVVICNVKRDKLEGCTKISIYVLYMYHIWIVPVDPNLSCGDDIAKLGTVSVVN